MGVGSITSMNSMSGIWNTAARSTDIKSKSIQNEIAGVQLQIQKASSKEELSINKKISERKKHQNEITRLNAELKRHQDEFLRSYKREIMMEKLQEDEGATGKKVLAFGLRAGKLTSQKNPEKNINTTDTDTSEKSIYNDEDKSAIISTDKSARQENHQGTVIFKNSDGTVILKDVLNQDKNQISKTKEEKMNEKNTKPLKEEDKDTGISYKEIYAIVSNDTSTQQTNRQEASIAKIRGGIAVLEGEISQDEKRGVNTDKKEAELEKLVKKEKQARMLQSLDSGKTDGTMKFSEKIRISGIPDTEKNEAFINMSKLSKKEQKTSRWAFHVVLEN